MSKETIIFPKKRDFGGIIGDAFYFTMRNFKSLITGFLLYVGPFILIGIIAELMAMRNLDLMDLAAFNFLSVGVGFLAFILFITIATIMLVAMTFGAIQKYHDIPEEPIIEGLWPYVRRNIGRIAVFTIAVAAASLIVIGIVAATTVGVHIGVGVFLGFILAILSIYCSVPLAIAPYIYVDEEVTLVDAVKRAFVLVQGKWWITFAIIIVLGLIAGMVSAVFVFPMYIAFFINMISSAEMTGEPIMSGMWLGIIYAVAVLSGLLVRIYQLIGIVMQYYSLKESKEGTTLIQRIQDLDVDA